jgi:4-hydroxy-tetrahydrodipicolinate synthase
VLRIALRVAARRLPVLMTIAEGSTAEGAALAQRAAKEGANGLMVLPGMRYVSDRRETLAHYRAIARASALPIMVYNNPVSYGVDVTPEMFAELADEKTIVSIKESSDNVRRVTDIINRVGERYAIFCGVDDLAMEAMLMGAVGWVAGLVDAFSRGNRSHLPVAAGRSHRGGARDLSLVRAAPAPGRLAKAGAEHQAGRGHRGRRNRDGEAAADAARGR